MPALSTHALAQLQPIRATFGEAVFADFRLYIETSPRYTQQVEAYLNPSRNGAVNVDPSVVNGAQYQVDRDDSLRGGLNNQDGLITFSATPSTFQRLSGWSVGYGLAEAFAHELGHAFDPRLVATAQQNAFAEGGVRQQTLVLTESEAAGEINAYLLMSEARSNLRDAAANPYVNLPFDPDMQVTAFRFAEGVIKGFLQTTAATDFTDTCSINVACLSQVTNAMGRSGYFNSIYQQLTNNPNAQFPAQQLLLAEEGNFTLLTNPDNPGQIDIVDKTTNQVVQTINTQVFEDGSSLLTLRNRDGSTDSVSVDASGRSVQISPARDESGYPLPGQQTILTRDRWNAIESTTDRTNFEDGSSIATTTTPDGKVVVKSYDTEGQLAGTITVTPDGAGGMNRVVNTTVNGNDVQITQHASATALGTDNDHDGNNTDPGDYTSTGITINGQPGVNSGITVALIDELYPSANDIIRARGTGNLNHITTAANPTDVDGVVPSPADLSGLLDWFNSPEAQGLGVALGDVTSLVGALRSGRPLSIATTGFNILSHYSDNPGIRELANGLSGVSSLIGLVNAFERGDLAAILIQGGGAVRSAITVANNSLTSQMIAEYGSVETARALGELGDEAAGELFKQSEAYGELLQDLGAAVAWISIINSLAHGDIKGAAIGVIAYIWPVAGAIIAFLDMMITASRDTPQFEAHGRFVGNSDGSITIATDGVNGGAYVMFNQTMQAMLDEAKREAAETTKVTGYATRTLENTTYFIAAPALFYWHRGLNYYVNTAENDDLWRIAA